MPDVKIAVSARPFSKSFSSHVQQLGRVMRPHPSKEFGIWLDHSGNYLRFRDDWDKLYTEGVDDLNGEGEKAKRELTQKEKEKAKCPACNALWVSHNNICSVCGFAKMNTKHIISIFGVLEELEMKRGSKSHGKSPQEFYSELLFIARKHKYADGWAYYNTKEKYGTAPKSLKPEVKLPTEETINWVKHQRIKYARGKGKQGVIK